MVAVGFFEAGVLAPPIGGELAGGGVGLEPGLGISGNIVAFTNERFIATIGPFPSM